MRVQLERIVPFPRDDVYAWWTDFREDDHRSYHSPASCRREILRQEGNELWLRERARRPAPVILEEHVVLHAPAGYSVETQYPGARVRYEYRFEPLNQGTRILLSAEIRPRHIGRLLLPLFRGRVRRYAERDTDYHLRVLERDLMTPAFARGPPR